MELETATNNLAQINLCDRRSTSTEGNREASTKKGASGLSRIPRPVANVTPAARGTYGSDADLPPRSISPPGSIEYRDGSDSSSFTTENGSTSSGRKQIKSKIQSFSNIKHAPTGGNVHVFHEKVDFSDVSSRCRSKENMKHKPGGGNIQVFDDKLSFKDSAQSKVGSFKNAKHVPGGGDKKIDNQALNWEVDSRVGSWKNVKHKPGGGNVQIESKNLNWDTTSKVGSWKNFRHKAGGGNVQIVDEQLSWDVQARTKHRLEPKKPRNPQQPGVEPSSEECPVPEVPIETDVDATPAAVSP